MTISGHILIIDDELSLRQTLARILQRAGFEVTTAENGEQGLAFDLAKTTFFLSRETIIPTPSPGMVMWLRRLFAIMSRNAQHATTFFRLPADRVVELGMQVEL